MSMLFQTALYEWYSVSCCEGVEKCFWRVYMDGVMKDIKTGVLEQGVEMVGIGERLSI